MSLLLSFSSTICKDAVGPLPYTSHVTRVPHVRILTPPTLEGELHSAGIELTAAPSLWTNQWCTSCGLDCFQMRQVTHDNINIPTSSQSKQFHAFLPLTHRRGSVSVSRHHIHATIARAWGTSLFSWENTDTTTSKHRTPSHVESQVQTHTPLLQTRQRVFV